MSLKSMHLSKLLKLFGATDSQLISELRIELRRERDKEAQGGGEGGRDFYIPFWSDARIHVIGAAHLIDLTKIRVEGSKQRQNLYPQLCQGFLKWFDGVKRGTNETVGWKEVKFHNHLDFDDLDLEVKVDNLLALQIGTERYRIIYPYFAKKPELSEKWARIALWAMTKAFPSEHVSEMEIVDVLRGRGFKGAQLSLRGDEAFLFQERYKAIRKIWKELRPHYGLK